MNEWAVYALILLLSLAVVFFVYRSIQRQIRRALNNQNTLDDSKVWLRTFSPVESVVINKKETISPEAQGIAKVDLDLKIHMLDGSFVQTTTCWLVEVSALAQLEPGQSVMVKFDPKKPERVFPAVPWARAWLFSK